MGLLGFQGPAAAAKGSGPWRPHHGHGGDASGRGSSDALAAS